MPSPYGEELRITWWGAVDYVGIDADCRLTMGNAPIIQELKAAWMDNGHLALLEGLSEQAGKTIIFTEFGYRSVDGANKVPGAHSNEAPLDMQEQADAYQAALDVLWGQPWLHGLFWWQWFANPNIGGESDDGFSPFGKPAEQVLTTFYTGD